MVRIMLVCSAGMSTSLLVTKMEEAAKNEGVDADIFAVASGAADEHLEDATKPIDVLLLGPQVRFMEGQFADKLKGTDVKLGVINMQDYGMMNGEAVLKTALEMAGK